MARQFSNLFRCVRYKEIRRLTFGVSLRGWGTRSSNVLLLGWLVWTGWGLKDGFNLGSVIVDRLKGDGCVVAKSMGRK